MTPANRLCAITTKVPQLYKTVSCNLLKTKWQEQTMGKKTNFSCLAENAWEISTQHNKNITAAKALSQGQAFYFPHFKEGSLRQLVLKGAIVVQS